MRAGALLCVSSPKLKCRKTAAGSRGAAGSAAGGPAGRRRHQGGAASLVTPILVGERVAYVICAARVDYTYCPTGRSAAGLSRSNPRHLASWIREHRRGVSRASDEAGTDEVGVGVLSWVSEREAAGRMVGSPGDLAGRIAYGGPAQPCWVPCKPTL